MPKSKEDAKHIPLLRGLASMLHYLDLDIVAEGIETERQKVICEKLKIHRSQGYFLAIPQSSQDIEKNFLAK